MAVTLPTQRTKPTTELGKQTILLYGFPKAGKSSMASRFPEAVFFETEPGLNHLEVYKIPTYTWDDFLAACKLIAQGNHPFKTVVIDTVDNAAAMGARGPTHLVGIARSYARKGHVAVFILARYCCSRPTLYQYNITFFAQMAAKKTKNKTTKLNKQIK